MIQFEQANKILKILEENNHNAYLVGGCVRDMLLNKNIDDIDICTSAKPEEIMKIFKDYTVVPTGLKHGTVIVVIKGNQFDITTYRTDGDYSDFRHPDSVEFVDNIVEDLSRRDFTINAIAQDSSGKIFDPFNGQEDLERKIIKAVGNPDKRFKEDPLRMLRAIRFSAKLSFTIEKETMQAIKNNADLLSNISAERIRDELKKILIYDPEKISLMEDLGLLRIFLPEVSNLFNCKQKNKWHYTDAMHHTFDTLKYSKKFDYLSDNKKLFVRLSLLLHDIGKIDTETIGSDGYQHYFHHPEYSYKRSKDILSRLKFMNYEIDLISKLVHYHDINLDPSRKSLNKIINKYNFSLYEFKLLGYIKECDISAHVNEKNDNRMKKYFKLLNLYKQKSKTDNILTINDLAIDGNEIMNILNIKPSKEVGIIKNELFNMVFYKPSLNKKEYLKKYLIKKYSKNNLTKRG